MVQKDKGAWAWVPVLYFTQGLPYVLVVTVSVIMYKKLGVSNEDIGLYTSILYLPWVLKPLWSPFVDLKSTKRKWFLSMQLLIAIALLGVGLTLPINMFFVSSLACFWMAAFASATNDIASDGYYMLGLTEKKQSFFVGMRSTFYRL
ncbi:MAG: MFS transporter, partial [Maribacter dokdonensis]